MLEARPPCAPSSSPCPELLSSPRDTAALTWPPPPLLE
jgi:hypothetical protein